MIHPALKQNRNSEDINANDEDNDHHNNTENPITKAIHRQ